MKSRGPRKGRAHPPGERAARRAAASGSGAEQDPAVADGPPSAPPTAAPRSEAEPRPDEGWLGRYFVPAAILVLLVAGALRLPELALNPFHHDEGVNGFFTTNLVRRGVYTYDPANYHGPALYYLALVSAILFGLTTEAMRLVPVVFGLATVALVLPLRRFLGPIATLTAAALLAVSPGAVYVSRYFIHESLLVCFSLAVVVAALLYRERPRAGYLLFGAAAAALVFATKETGIITFAVLAIAAVVSGWYVRARSGDPRPNTVRRRAGAARRARPRPRSIVVDGVEYRATTPEEPSRARLPSGIHTEHAIASVVVFLVIYVLLYSSFFTNPDGLRDSLATFTVWTQTGAATQVQPFQAYLVWMLRAEAPILILGSIGGLIAAIRGRDRLTVFVGLWALGTTLAYSLIQYKTPWIIINMVVPLALLAGIAMRELAATARWRRAVPLVLAGAIGWSGYQAIDLNYVHYDDETYPYVFVHTDRQTLHLVDEIERVAEAAGTGKETGVVFTSVEYWPLPWYMRDYPRAGFFGKTENLPTDEAMIVANANQEAELAPTIGDRYERRASYRLRPGVDLVLYVRRDIADR
jgi:uncharacterized protein (TIGR03663 family)